MGTSVVRVHIFEQKIFSKQFSPEGFFWVADHEYDIGFTLSYHVITYHCKTFCILQAIIRTYRRISFLHFTAIIFNCFTFIQLFN